MTVEFLLFGPVQARIDGRPVQLGHARQRAVLAALLVDVNRPVPVDRLVERVWADHRPQRAQRVLYSYLSRLRRVLATVPGVQLTRAVGGYVVTADPPSVDLYRFRRLLGEARGAGSSERAVVAFERALGLWREEPFAGLDTSWFAAEREALRRQRFTAELERNDVALALGRHASLVDVLTTAADGNPHDERLAGQLMLARYRCGRQADALAHYERVRRLLADDLGADPSPALQRLHRQILTADPALSAPTPVPARPDDPNSMGSSVPRQLPAQPRSFTGRGDELAQLDAVLTADGEPSTSVVIAAVSGTPGVGKTALALHWAHRAADRFPDGQLYVNLRGFDPGGPLLDPAAAVRGFLDGLGVPAQRIPADQPAQSALYRSLVAGKRLLVVVDNARDAEQVRPLLPGSPACAVLVTSRTRLSGLVAVEGAYPITLDLLPVDDARALLAGRLGTVRVAAEPAAVDDIIGSCARLPLALAIVAARAAGHPAFPLHALAGELRDTRGRLDALTDTDPTGDLRAVFSWSYQRLGADAARLFRLLGLTPGPDITAPAAASLAGVPPERTRRLLAQLTHAHLLTEHLPGRYTFHDLLRAYAAEQAHTHDSDADRHTALGALLGHYLSGATAAMGTLYPGIQHWLLRLTPAPAAVVPRMADQSGTQAWLDAERANLVAAGRYATAQGWTAHGIELARVLTHFLDTGGHYCDALLLHTDALRAARVTGDHAAEAWALTALGLTFLRRGELSPAAEHVDRALTLSRQVGDRDTEASALAVLGTVCWWRGELSLAADHLAEAVALCRRVGNRFIEAQVLICLGAVRWRRGDLELAADHLRQAVTAFRQLGHRADEAYAMAILGMVFWRRGKLSVAAEHLRQALALCRQVGNIITEAVALTGLGAVCWRRGDLEPAAAHLHHALTLLRQIGDRATEAAALTFLGSVRWQRGDLEPAAAHVHQALSLSRQVGDRATEASALTLLGLLDEHSGGNDRALDHLHQGLALARQVGDRAVEADALTALGVVHGRCGEPDSAVEHLQQARDLCRRIGYRPGEADALNALGDVLGMRGSAQQTPTEQAHVLRPRSRSVAGTGEPPPGTQPPPVHTPTTTTTKPGSIGNTP